jgi:hypothetical protein
MAGRADRIEESCEGNSGCGIVTSYDCASAGRDVAELRFYDCCMTMGTCFLLRATCTIDTEFGAVAESVSCNGFWASD